MFMLSHVSSRRAVTISAILLTLLSAAAVGPALAAEVVGRDIVAGDPAAAEALSRVEARETRARIEVIGVSKQIDPITGHHYTLLKARVGLEDVTAVLNEDTGSFATDPLLPERESRELLARLPGVYGKLTPELAALVRQFQGGVLGGSLQTRGILAVVFHAKSPPGLDAIEEALGDIARTRFDAEALFRGQPPEVSPRKDGTLPQAPPPPRIFTVSAEVPIEQILRIGGLDAVTGVEILQEMTPRLDVSVPRIHGDTTRGYGLNGFSTDIGIVDSGIDRTHPNLPYVTMQMDFTGAGRQCDGGLRVGACQSNCTPGVCDSGTRTCLGPPNAGQTCCPGGVCETIVGDTGGHGTHVAGIAGNNSVMFRGMAHFADLINAKAIPGPNAPAALAFAQGAGADVINGSYGATSQGCAGVCTAPAASVGNLCLQNSHCNSPPAVNNGVCGAPLGVPCIVNATCDPPGAPGTGLCTSAVSDGKSGSTRAVDFQVYRNNVSVVIAAEERPYNGRCSNANGTACWGDAACPAGGHCLAYPSQPNDTFNGIAVGSTNVTPGNSTVSSFSQRGPTVDTRSKPDIVAPGEAPPSGQCIGGGNNGNPCNDVLGDTDCPGGGNCTSTRCVGLCTAPAYLAGRKSCSANADCDSAVGTGDGACALGANVGLACTDTRNSPECPGGACRFYTDADGIDSCAADWEGVATGRCSAPAVNMGVGCLVNSDCDNNPGDGMCGTRPGRPAPGTANPAFVDLEGTSMAAPHVTGLAAQLWDYGNNHNILKDTPYLKATILNTAHRLGGWTRPSISQPLDIAQGTGEADALEAFHAYADDLRVWQQRVTGTAPKNSHWYWTDLTAGQTVTLTLVFERHESNLAAAAFTPLNDLDLYLHAPNNAVVERSISSVDSVEHIVYTVPTSGRYCVEVDPFALPSGAELYAVAGTPQELNFTGTVNPCHPDFGDAPDPFTAPALYPTKLVSNGARHKDWTKEWLGTSRPEIDGDLEKPTLAVHSRVDPFPSVSPEDDAIDPLDEDGVVNLTDRDGWDDGVVIPGPFLPGVPKIIFITVQCTVDDSGVGPLGRYDATVPTKRLYLNGWADWDGNGFWGGPGEKIVGTGSPTGRVAIDPQTFGPNGRYTLGESFTDSNGSGRWEPDEPFVDSVGKTERTFSFVVVPPLVLAPNFYLRFRVDYGEDVGLIANVSGTLAQYVGEAQFGEVEDYNQRYEIDFTPHSLATVEVRIPADSTISHTVELTGPSTIQADLGTIADTDGNGREQVSTQMVQLDLTGTDPDLGTVIVHRRDPTLHPFQTSMGQIEEDVNTTTGTLDVPPFTTSPPGLCADSFFNVFFEVQLPDLGLTLHNHRPKRMTSRIYNKPPREGDTYSNPDYIPLYDAGENLVAVLGPSWHTPNPRPRKREIDLFPKSRATMDIRVPAAGAPNIVQLEGPTTVAVDIGDVADTDNNGLEQVKTEMLDLELSGTSPSLGPLIVRTRSSSLHPFMATTGRIEENTNLTQGTLDLPPFVTSPPNLDAASTFDVYLEVEVVNLGGLKLHNHIPKQMSATIRHKPPAPGDIYQSPQFIPLYDDAENFVALIGPGSHVPNPLNASGACCSSGGAAGCVTPLSQDHCTSIGGTYLGDGSSCPGSCASSNSPPGVPNTLRVQKVNPAGNPLLVTWVGSSCPAADYELLYGSQYPGSLQGVYSITGGICSTGGAPQTTFNTPPVAPGHALWMLVAATDGLSTEGPLGRNSGQIDRTGPGPGGSSQVCRSDKNLDNTCGQTGCTPTGGTCSQPSTCCSGACSSGHCCAPEGSSCATNSQCCGGSCVGGICQTACRTNGQTCSLSSQCCSQNCDGGTCHPACSLDGQACATNGQCCSGNCHNGFCAPTCAANGGACASPGDCCSGLCAGGQCCGNDFEACTSGGQCCGRSCVAGQCQSECFPTAFPCSNPIQCCSGSCLGGACQSGCVGTGQGCAFPDQCCSGSCTNGTCQATCTPSGGGCSNAAQCCGGQCQAGMCCTSNGQTCTLDGECCSGNCDQGHCAAVPECKSVGDPCAAASECCTQRCVAGVCQCAATGQSCTGPSQCCTGNCLGGVCQAGCAPNGQPCTTGAQCCSALCAGGFCQSCLPDGQVCTSGSQCCGGTCLAGFCQSACFPDGQTCSVGAQCCSNNCQSGFCQPPCFPVGAPCTIGSQCCSTICAGGFCQSCLPDGQTCSSGSQCCGGNCIAGFCQSTCRPDGQACTVGAQCCSTSCNAGICGPPTCAPNGQPCGSPGQCCSGNCTAGFCQPCFPTGQPCTTGTQCCTLNCQGGFCQPGTCFPNGQPCSLPSQCCSLGCQSGFCCTLTGQSCTTSSQCCSHFCFGGFCSLTE